MGWVLVPLFKDRLLFTELTDNYTEFRGNTDIYTEVTDFSMWSDTTYRTQYTTYRFGLESKEELYRVLVIFWNKSDLQR